MKPVARTWRELMALRYLHWATPVRRTGCRGLALLAKEQSERMTRMCMAYPFEYDSK